MSLLKIADVLAALVPIAAGAQDAYEPFREEPIYTNTAALATTTAMAETTIFCARHKSRVIGSKFMPAAAVTGAATNYFSVVIAVRHAAAPATQKIIATYNADTAGTKDVAAFAIRDLWAAGDVNAAAADADFILAVGDVVTMTVTKAGTGMTFPIASQSVITEARD